MRVTMRDIAEKLNVSVNTVSKALNGKAKISQDLRVKILKTAEEMGYVKNQYAARLATSPVKIGVIVCGHDENYYSYTLEGLQKAFRELIDCNVSYEIKLFEPNDKLRENVEKAFSYFEENLFDGVIINDFHGPMLHEKIDEMTDKGICVALLNYDAPQSKRAFSVISDYAMSANIAAEMLAISLKHTDNKSVLVSALSMASYGQEQIRRAFQQAAEKYHLQLEGICTSNEELIEKLSPDIGGIYVTHAKHLSICQAICEKSFSPVLICSDIYPEMIPYFQSGVITASVYQNPVLQAYQTVMKLYHHLIGKESAQDMVIPTTLVLRSNYQAYL